MPRFAPFRGIRYDLGRVDLADVTAPPYDVLDADDRAALVARNPANVVVVDLPVATDPGADPYQEAAATFARWQDERVLVRDQEPSFYVYRMRYRDELGQWRHTTGVLGALELTRPGEAAPGTQPILPHEHTTPKAKSDRLQLQRATRANLSPVWGLSPAQGLTALLGTDTTPLTAWEDDDGVIHELWRLSDPGRLADIAERVAAEPVVIADGHHRYETALTYRDELVDAGNDPTDAGAVLTWVVELADDELTVHAIHRLLSGLPAGFDLLGALTPWFEPGAIVTPSPTLPARLADEGALALVEPDRIVLLHPRAEALATTRDLDTSRLDVALAALPAHELVFQHGVDQVLSRVAKGEAQAGVLLRPAGVAQIVDIAHGGERMPPKTTFFYPKPRTGVVFRPLD